MKPFKTFALLLALATLATGCGNFFKPAAAVVDGRVITLAELDRRIASQFPKGQAPAAAQKLEAERKELAQMIQDQIVQSEAERRHLSVPTSEVEGRYQQIRSQFRTEEEFNAALTQQGVIPGTVKDRIKLRLAVEAIQKQFSANVTVTAEAIRNAYGKGEAFTKARVRHILFAAQQPAQFPAALKKAQAALNRIRKGEDFATLAKQLSQDPGSKPQGGDLGEIQPGRTVPEFEKAAFSLKPGQTSLPVRTQFGYHLIQTIKISHKTLKQATPELRTQLAQRQSQQDFNDFLAKRVARADIRVNPRIGSFDPKTLAVIDKPFYTPASPAAQPEGIPGLQIPNGQPVPDGQPQPPPTR